MYVEQYQCLNIQNGDSTGSTMRNSVSTPPSDSKMLDCKSSGGSSGKGICMARAV